MIHLSIKCQTKILNTLIAVSALLGIARALDDSVLVWKKNLL